MLYDCFRSACSIELKDIVILTGGLYTQSKVTVYNNEGFVADWPELKTGRSNHGCGHFVNTDNKVVRHIDMERGKCVFEGYCILSLMSNVLKKATKDHSTVFFCLP